MMGMEDADNCNALMLPAKKTKYKASKDHNLRKIKTRPLSKNEQRKLRRLQEEQEEKARRAEILKALETHKISEDAYALLYASATRGQKESMRKKLQRAVLYKRAGLKLPTDAPLLRERSVVEAEAYQGTEHNFEDQIVSETATVIEKNVVDSKTQSTGCCNYRNDLPLVIRQAHSSEDSKAATILPSLKLSKLATGNDGLDADNLKIQQGPLKKKKTHVNLSKETDVVSMEMVEKDLPSCDVEDNTRKDTFTTCCSKTMNAVLADRRPKFIVHIVRSEDVQNAREKLPILMMEQEIMEAIAENPVTIICGETGCGKTTQIPQFLYEAGFSSSDCLERSGMIGITQPRRVAVLATAKRLAYEMNLHLGQEVGFQVRHDRKVESNTRIKFMTDGILLREVQSDFLLKKYSAIVLDEAHERSLNTDILIGMLSRIVPLRQGMYEEQSRAGTVTIHPLKLVVMSATLSVDEFVANKQLFASPPPVIEVPGRQFSVSVHFSAKTELLNYVDKAYKKVCAIHKKLPPGGVLVFLTGQAEVHHLCKRLQKAFNKTEDKAKLEKQLNNDDADLQGLSDAVDDVAAEDEFDDETGIAENLELSESDLDSESDLEFSDTGESDETEGRRNLEWIAESSCNLESIKCAFDSLAESEMRDGSERPRTEKQTINKSIGPLHVLPLYALLPAALQLKIFGAIPEGARLVVVATNVAETSITIPGIRYVVDCGRVKEKVFECGSGISRFEVRWISKASAAQRAGRSGRTGPGHCYRLYSSAVFNDIFPDFSQPEIYRVPIEGLVLTLKSMNIVKVNNFPFVSEPDKASLIEAENCLRALSALDSNTGLLTPLGHSITIYPISPRHSRMLLTAMQIECSNDPKEICTLLAYAAATVAALSLDSPFMTDKAPVEDQVERTRQHSLHEPHSADGDPKLAQTSMDAKSGESKTSAESRSNRNKELDKSGQRKSRKRPCFSHPFSDALGVVKALQAYEMSTDPEEFCAEKYMHARILYEMSKLRKQLIHIYLNVSKEKGADFIALHDGITAADVEHMWMADERNQDPSVKHDIILRQAICAGWADRVARKISILDMLKTGGIEEKKSQRGIWFQTCTTEEKVYVHPSSSLRKHAPDFVVYDELVRTSRPYMRMLTSVDASWLVTHARPLCTFSKPLSDPSPWYDSVSDDVYCWVSPSFGPHVWQLPLQKCTLKSKKHRIAVFACALLKGKVLPAMKLMSQHLAADPSILMIPAGVVQKRASELLHALAAASVDTRHKLKCMWDVQDDFLFKEILSWLQKNCHSHLENIWTELKLEALQDGRTLWGKKRKRK